MATKTIDTTSSGGLGKSRWLQSGSWRALIPVAGWLVVWQLSAQFLLDNPRIFPTIDSVFGHMWDILGGESGIGSSYSHIGATLARVLLAFVISFVIGTILGIGSGLRRGIYDFVSNVVWLGFAIPSVIWAYVLLVILGITNIVPIIAVAVLLLAPTVVNTAEAVKSFPRDLVVLANALNAGVWQRLWEIYLPGLLPVLVANARVAFALGLKIVIIAEVVGLPNGIGLVVRYWYSQAYIAPIVAWGLLFVLFGLLIDRGIFGVIEARTRRYLPRH